MKKLFATLLIVACALTATFVYAAIQTFDGTGKYIMSEFETEDIARQHAIQKATEDAQDKAGVYLTSFSQSVNAHLAADEISAVTNNIIEVSDVQVAGEPFEVNGEPGIIWTVTLKATIDPDGIWDFVKRDEKDKVTIVQQNTQLRDAIAKNDEQVADLKEQYKRATTQAERDKIRQQMKQADRDFLANEKIKEGNRLAYAKDYNGAIRLFNEAIELNPNFADAYYNRGNCYYDLGQYEQAIQDFDKAIELNPNDAYAYDSRGMTYFNQQQYERAIQDFDEAIKLNPNDAVAYIIRGCSYFKKQQYERAIRDFDRYIQLVPNNPNGWQLRGYCHQYLGDESKAQDDFAKAKQLGFNG